MKITAYLFMAMFFLSLLSVPGCAVTAQNSQNKKGIEDLFVPDSFEAQFDPPEYGDPLFSPPARGDMS